MIINDVYLSVVFGQCFFLMLFDPTRTIDVVLLARLLKLIEQRDFILNKMDTDILPF